MQREAPWRGTLRRTLRTASIDSDPKTVIQDNFRAASALVVCVVALICSRALAEKEKPSFPKEQIAAGAELYAINCSPCHGPHMLGADSAFNLRKFPPDQRERFVTSVTRGKNQMPPWGDFFKADQLEALWAYVTAGER
jgi:mono/diheme cytochrome c family protein